MCAWQVYVCAENESNKGSVCVYSMCVCIHRERKIKKNRWKKSEFVSLSVDQNQPKMRYSSNGHLTLLASFRKKNCCTSIQVLYIDYIILESDLSSFNNKTEVIQKIDKIFYVFISSRVEYCNGHSQKCSLTTNSALFPGSCRIVAPSSLCDSKRSFNAK